MSSIICLLFLAFNRLFLFLVIVFLFVFDVYVERKAWLDLLAHFDCEAVKGLEAMGLLVGDVFVFEGKKWVYVREYVTAENNASSVSVKFSEGAFKDLVPLISSKISDSIIVGWAHAHPSYGCFLSSTDVSTQKTYFSESFNVALVVDPVRHEKKFFRLNVVGYTPVSFAVVEKRRFD